jgi:hypothetical protein
VSTSWEGGLINRLFSLREKINRPCQIQLIERLYADPDFILDSFTGQEEPTRYGNTTADCTAWLSLRNRSRECRGLLLQNVDQRCIFSELERQIERPLENVPAFAAYEQLR